MITRYRAYLEFLDKELAKMFEAQKPFIKCKEGCAYCCKEGEYPISELEYINLMLCFNDLPDEIKDKKYYVPGENDKLKINPQKLEQKEKSEK